MATMYVGEQGAVVRRRGERLVVTRERETLEDVPLIHIDQLVIEGRGVQVTTAAIHGLFQRRVPVVFLKKGGGLVGTGHSFEANNHAALRVAQYEKAQDTAASLLMARGVVMGKLHNQRVLLQRQAGTVAGLQAQSQLRRAIDGVGQMLARAEQAASLDSLRGFEGSGARFYFEAWRALLPPELPWQGRAFHPPPDPVNALLSFGYTLLLKELMGAVQIVGLDPYIGFFHVIERGRPSLPLDVEEEFRPVLVDALVLELIHGGQITPGDFERTGNAKRPVQLTDGGRRTFLHAYEARLATRVTHPVEQRVTTWRRCLELQVRQIANIVLGQATAYVPMRVR